MKPKSNSIVISASVARFCGRAKRVFVIPGTARHSANFYGDSRIIALSRRELADTIACYHYNYGGGGSIAESISDILSDMQLDRPQ
jgi:hypothetical protein